MSVKHPIIAVTGSSGAGTTTVMKSFTHIFRRERINAQIVEGDAFHRHDRLGMREALKQSERDGVRNFQAISVFRRRTCSKNSKRNCLRTTAIPVADSFATMFTTTRKLRSISRMGAPSRRGKTSRPAPI